MDVKEMPVEPVLVRGIIRNGNWPKPTPGLTPGSAQVNLAILPKELAFDFLLFCQRNPKPCPLLEVLEPGQWEPKHTAPGADLRTDIPSYRIYRNGKLENEIDNLMDYWQDDFVSFLLGCSFTFETAMLSAGINVRHIEEGKNVPMYRTNIETAPAGIFHGPLVVTMRPIPYDLVSRAVQVTSRYPAVHGSPIQVGDPESIGIYDLSTPDWGDQVTINDGEVPVFWACGVTPQAVALESKPSLMVTHSPGCMFITDVKDEHLAAL